ncbi:MAG TPA: hypothetical protein VM692_04140 [Gammaproteobacteria bacterium]|nr:hypothetical protein [Gammaproteobacteria bacterium]
MNDTTKGPPQKPGFPLWGSIAIPAGLLWGTALGAGAGLLFGNLMIGALIGAGLGVGVGFTLFAAAIVIASSKL